MAYSDYGAFVYCCGSREENREDQIPYQEHNEADWLKIFDRKAGELSPHHGVMGNGPVRFCAYKGYPCLYVNGEQVDLGDVITHTEPDYEIRCKGSVLGYEYEAAEYNRMLYLTLTEPDGTFWRCKSGYSYGAGHMKDDRSFSNDFDELEEKLRSEQDLEHNGV